VRLATGAVQSIAMALHELAANAVRHGALSREAGRVAVAWEIRDAPGGPAFVLTWRETGGPEVAPPERRGFGTTVTTAMVEAGTRGAVDLDFAPGGLTWRLVCPAATVLDGAEEGTSVPDPDAGGPGAVQAPRSLTADGTAGGGAPVLVVEDEPLVGQEMAQMLSEAGYAALGPAISAAEALAILDREPCAAAVLDVNLGHGSSDGVARALARRGVPFVVVTSYARDQLSAPFDTAPLLGKPVRGSDLVTAVGELAGRTSAGFDPASEAGAAPASEPAGR
jgi:CheY-like chemotaxis protein